jgi:FAD-dependent urate hydroxylase
VPGYVVSRADLQTVLLEALEPGSLETGAKCVGVETTAEGTVVCFENGRLVAGDVIVGADGIHSAVRRAVVGEVMPRFAGFAAWVGIMDNAGLMPADTATEYLGVGQRFGLLPMTAGRVYYSFACRWEEGTRKPADGWTPFLQKRFAGWPVPALEVLHRMGISEPICLEIHDLPVLPSWEAGRIALLGDAAHATTPTLGQGACQALEDAAALGRCLADFPDVPEALAHYELERKSRADDIVARARVGAEKMHAPTEDVYRKLYQSIRASSVTQTLSVAERWLAQGSIG